MSRKIEMGRLQKCSEAFAKGATNYAKKRLEEELRKCGKNASSGKTPKNFTRATNSSYWKPEEGERGV